MNEVLLIFALSTSPVDSQAIPLPQFDHVQWPINIEEGAKNSGEAEIYVPSLDEFITISWKTNN